MKYYLAFDRGEGYYGQQRYVVIPLSLFDSNLDINDNFEVLCKFTMQYEREADLKKTIFTQLPEFKFYQTSSLVILKGQKQLGELVPYKKMSSYFDLKVLEEIILKNIRNQEFRTLLLAPYSHIKYFEIASNNLKRAGEMELNYNFLRRCVNSFLVRVCMDGSNVDYRQVYKMAILVMSSLGLIHDEPNHLDELSDDFGGKEEDTDSPVAYQKEWLERRARLRQLGQW